MTYAPKTGGEQSSQMLAELFKMLSEKNIIALLISSFLKLFLRVILLRYKYDIMFTLIFDVTMILILSTML